MGCHPSRFPGREARATCLSRMSLPTRPSAGGWGVSPAARRTGLQVLTKPGRLRSPRGGGTDLTVVTHSWGATTRDSEKRVPVCSRPCSEPSPVHCVCAGRGHGSLIPIYTLPNTGCGGSRGTGYNEGPGIPASPGKTARCLAPGPLLRICPFQCICNFDVSKPAVRVINRKHPTPHGRFTAPRVLRLGSGAVILVVCILHPGSSPGRSPQLFAPSQHPRREPLVLLG